MKNITVLLLIAVVVCTTACKDQFESSNINVTLDKDVLYLVNGNKANLAATVDPENSSEVTWTSSNAEVATVTQTGEVTATSVGKATISVVTRIGRRVATCDVFVDPIRVTGVTVAPTTLAMLVYETESLTVTVSPGNAADKLVTWSSSNEDVVTVNEITGEMKALLPGLVTITVTTRDGEFTASCDVTVSKIPVENVTLSETSLELNLGDMETLRVTVTPDDATFPEVTWSTSNKDVATIDKGVLTAVGAGDAIISVTADGITAECNVIVKAPSGYTEKVIWEGSKAIGWGDPVALLAADFEGVPAGAIMTFYFQQKENTWSQAQICQGGSGWPQFSFAELGGGGTFIPTDIGGWNNLDYTSQEFLLTQDILDKISGNPDTGNGVGIYIQGSDLTFTKVTIKVPVEPIQKIIWEGSKAIGWGDPVALLAADFEGVPAGAIMTFYFQQKENTWSQAQICQGGSGWPQFSFTELGGGGTFIPTDIGGWNNLDYTSQEFLLTQDILDKISGNPDTGNGVGIYIQGSDLTFTKVTITIIGG